MMKYSLLLWVLKVFSLGNLNKAPLEKFQRGFLVEMKKTHKLI